MEDGFEDEHAFNAGIAIGARFAAQAGLFVVEPGFYRVAIKPEGKASPVNESRVILRPVTDAVLLFVFSHKLNITALPHPCYLCSNAVQAT